MPSVAYCSRCKRMFATEDLRDGLCSACHSNMIPQWAVDLTEELQALPPEADMFDWARRIMRTVYMARFE